MGLIEAIIDVFLSEPAYGVTARFAAILLFAACGEWIAERAGTINISVEGMLLGGGLMGAVGYQLGGSVAIGLAFGALGGLAISAVQAEMSHRLTADQFVVGLTLNILVVGLAGFFDSEFDLDVSRASTVSIPWLVDIPLFGEALFGQPWPFLLLYALVPFSWWLMFRTRWGLEVRASGEDPQAADVSGIDVNKRRRQTIYYTGFTSGLGGAFWLFAQVGQFNEDIVNGRGYIAIAAVIFGGWTLRGTIAGSVLFAGALAFRLSLQVVGYTQVNSEFLQAFPFLLTILGMAIFAKRVRAPAALARPFIRGLK